MEMYNTLFSFRFSFVTGKETLIKYFNKILLLMGLIRAIKHVMRGFHKSYE